jgi:adenylate cyclase
LRRWRPLQGGSSRYQPALAEADLRRHRAAVFATDAVGYLRLMHNVERAPLIACRAAFRAAISRYGSRLVDMAVDSVLAVYEAPLAAVRVAEDAQREMATNNALLPVAQRLQFRVGVYADDILE